MGVGDEQRVPGPGGEGDRRELLELGHVRRQPNPDDGRSYVVTTTAAGRRAIDRAEGAVLRARQAVADELDVPLPEVEAVVEKLNAALDAALAARREPPWRHRYA